MLSELTDDEVLRNKPAVLWTPEPRAAATEWRAVDSALREIRRKRSGLDAEEMHWLRQAEALKIWRHFGMVSVLDYLERALNYATRTAQDRLRVARALGSLPQLTAALDRDELAFSAVRSLTRVATPATEAAWIAAASGKNMRDIDEMVAHRRPGDRPDDPPDPQPRTQVVRFELAAETFALLRQARVVLDDEHGTNLSDDAFVAALCNAVLDGAPQAEPTGRAKFQIAVTVCERCQQGWQHGAGAKIPIDAAAVDRAMCDAQHIGSIDATAPERAYQDIPPSVARLVWHRDGGRCRVDGCGSARGLELHHIVHRADGGSHEALNIILCCFSCHQAHHAGRLTISGTAEQLAVHRPDWHTPDVDRKASIAPPPIAPPPTSSPPTMPASGRVHIASAASTGVHVSVDDRASVSGIAGDHGTPTVGRASRLDEVILQRQAKAALTGLGWKPAIAHAAVTAATAAQGPDTTLERLIFESLRQCPKPKA